MEEDTRSPRVVVESRQKIVRIALVMLGAAALVLMGGAGVVYSIRTNPKLSEKFGIKNQAQINQAEINSLVKEVGKIMMLPSDETPTLATVTELDKVKDQQFFKNASNGDKVLIYSIAKKAILYRPSEKKIIEVGVVNTDQQNGATAGSSTENIEPVNTQTPSPQVTAKPTVRPTAEQSKPTPTILP